MVVSHNGMHRWNIFCDNSICSDHCPSSNLNRAKDFGPGPHIHPVREGWILFGKIINLAPRIASAERHLVHERYAFTETRSRSDDDAVGVW